MTTDISPAAPSPAPPPTAEAKPGRQQTLLQEILSGSWLVSLLAIVLATRYRKPVPIILGILVAIAIAIHFPTWATVTTLAIIVSFQLVTIPVATHMVGRAGYRTKHLRRSMLYRDELAEAVDRAEAREVARERRREFGTDENDG